MSFIGYVVGHCPRCGQELRRKHPAEIAVCDCYKYCPYDHGSGKFGTKLEPYVPDMTPGTYGQTFTKGLAIKGISVEPRKDDESSIYVCKHHDPPLYFSQRPIEVQLE